MHIIKLNAIDSTQLFLKRYIATQTAPIPDTVAWALQQTDGIGQYGTSWRVEEGKNLTFSMLHNVKEVLASDYFLLNMAVSLAIIEVLEALPIPHLKIKWPNDILSSDKKIGGVLIENGIRSGEIVRSVIGIGINVNQTDFEHLPRASSLKNSTGKEFDLETLLYHLTASLQEHLARIGTGTFANLYENYQKYLYRIDQKSMFCTPDKTGFSGIIRGVTPSGLLQIELEKGNVATYNLKEIEMLY
ncbi:MAG: biotin--[acetyl-CoA-carboxylase] ligase [Capnocytophaga sp.]|nr:biotin--[acetyl-CoA-carboxylase] ligase [Capnocytophaga sp.]